MRIVHAAAMALCLTAGCAKRDEGSEAPANVPGTIETAMALTLGACGTVNEKNETAGVTVVLNLDGKCVFEVGPKSDDCRTYEGMELEIDGVRLTQTYSGGPISRGCTFPLFDTPCEQASGTTRCTTAKLISRDGGAQRITLRFGGETRVVEVTDWLTKRQIQLVGDRLIPGQRATVNVTPESAQNVWGAFNFDYDDEALNRVWCAHTDLGVDYDKGGSCDKGCCSTSQVAVVSAGAGQKNNLSFFVPDILPAGSGRLNFSATNEVPVKNCPFARCSVQVDRRASIPASVGP